MKKTIQKRIKGNELLSTFVNRTCTVFMAGFLSLRLVPQPFTRSVVKFCSFVPE